MMIKESKHVTPASFIQAAAIITLIVCTTAGYVSGCGTSGVLPATDTLQVAMASQRWHGTTARDLEQGRNAYRERCSGCHSLYSPAQYTEQQWDTLLPVMQHKARTGDTERAQIEKYVRVHAKK